MVRSLRSRYNLLESSSLPISVHNTHMLASGWVLVYESFKKMQEIGLTDNEVLAQLKSGSKFRPIYLAAYELLKKLVFAGQQRLRSIAQNTRKSAISATLLSLIIYLFV